MKTLFKSVFRKEISAIFPEESAKTSGEADPLNESDQRAKLESLGLFVGTIAHSIKGLCTGLDGGLYLMKSGEANGDEERRQRGVAMIQRNANRLRRLVNNTLYYGKERPLALSEVCIEEILTDVVETLGNKAHRLGIEFNSTRTGPYETMIADISALTAAIVNLVENALDACAADAEHKPHTVALRAHASKEKVCFYIRDNGIGMNLADRQNATELFFSSKGSSGTGLGLFIAEQIASRHGGALDIQSSIGEGTSITVMLPRNRGIGPDEKEVALG